MAEQKSEKDMKALSAASALADRWQEVLTECKQADSRWILDRSVTTLDTCLSELRAALRGVIPPEERFDCGHAARTTGCGGCDPGANRREHRFILERQECTCGWRPPLGSSMYREFDRHLLSTTDA